MDRVVARHPFALGPVLFAAVFMLLVLLTFAGRYDGLEVETTEQGAPIWLATDLVGHRASGTAASDVA